MTSRPLRLERIFPYAIFLITGAVFLPVILWLLQQTAHHDQLLHAFMVFCFTGFLLILHQRISIQPVFQFTKTVQNLLMMGYALLIIAFLTKITIFTLLAFSVCVGAVLLFVFGRARQRVVLSSMGAFAAFTVFAAYLPYLDWPLRSIAGKWSAAGLSLFGKDATLGLYVQGEPMLLLFHDGRPFHVAAECNGFGIITSALLMTCLIVFYRRIPVFDRILLFVFAILLAFVFNTLRIIAIVLIAPRIPESSYMLMHEIVGMIATYGGLAILYFLLIGKGKAAGEAQPTAAALKPAN